MRFHGMLVCGNQKCNENIFLAGKVEYISRKVLNKDNKEFNIYVEELVNMSEFFVLRKYRRRGVGHTAAHDCFNQSFHLCSGTPLVNPSPGPTAPPLNSRKYSKSFVVIHENNIRSLHLTFV